MNMIVNRKQQAVKFHVDDLMSSTVLPKVNDEFAKWLNKKYGQHGKVTTNRGNVHDYLGMVFDFSAKGKVTIDMTDYVAGMLEETSVKLKPEDTAPTPAGENLFNIKPDSPLLPKKQAEDFHTIATKGLFVCCHARSYIHTAIAALCTRVRAPT